MVNVNAITTLLSICTFGFIWFSIFVGNEIKDKEKYDSFMEDICNITKITVPKQPPDSSNHENWNECYCEGQCHIHGCYPKIKSYAAYINFYSNIAPDIIIKNTYGTKKISTFEFDCACPPGNDLYYSQLLEAENIYDTHYNKFSLCYHNNPITEIYLDDTYDDSSLVFLSLTLVIMFCVIICVIYILKTYLIERRTNESYLITVYWNNCCMECKYALNACLYECHSACYYMCMGCARLLCCYAPENIPDDNDANVNMNANDNAIRRAGALGRYRPLASPRNYNTFKKPYENGEITYYVEMADQSLPSVDTIPTTTTTTDNNVINN